MKNGLLALLLAISLCFNVFFVVGAFQVKDEAKDKKTKTSEEAINAFAEALGLNEEQKNAYAAIRGEYETEKENREKKKIEDHEKLWAELIKETPDTKAIDDYIAASDGTDRRRAFADRMLRLMKLLNPEQRVKAAEHFKKLSSNKSR